MVRGRDSRSGAWAPPAIETVRAIRILGCSQTATRVVADQIRHHSFVSETWNERPVRAFGQRALLSI
jgi:hypothetical protein